MAGADTSHPNEAAEKLSNRWKLAAALVIVASLAGIARSGAPMRAEHERVAKNHPAPGAPRSILLSVQDANARVNDWRDRDVTRVVSSLLRHDDCFVLSYAALAACIGGLVGYGLRNRGRTYTPQLVGLPVALGLTDLAENFLARAQLDLGSPLPALVVHASATATALKYTLLAIVGIVFVWQLGRVLFTRATSRPGLATPGEVRYEERRYLARRRGLDPATDLHAIVPVGLAFSGGGIRSATFNLGTLQALASHRLLPHVDYLSTVSGGGYIGGALSSLLSLARERGNRDKAGRNEPRFGTTPERFPFNPEKSEQRELEGFDGADEVSHLRTHGDFLVARRNFFSRELMRAVGGVISGILIHLAVFTVFLTGVAGVLVAHVAWTTGRAPADLLPFSIPTCQTSGACAEAEAGPQASSIGSYVTALALPGASGGRPALLSGGLTGAVVALLVLLAGFVLPRWHRHKRRSGTRTGAHTNDADGRTPEELDEGSFLAWLLGTTSVAVGLVTWRRRQQLAELHALLAPLAFCLAGLGVSLLVHVLFESWRPRDSKLGRLLGWLSSERTRRSRIAATQGWFLYLSLGALLLTALPYALYRWGNAGALPGEAKTGGVLALVLTRWLAGRGGESGAAGGIGGAIGWGRKIARLAEPLRNAVLGALVTGLVLVAVIGLGAGIGAVTPNAAALGHYAFAVALLAFAVFGVLGIVVDFNRISAHHFYRDRLAETYLETWIRRGGSGGRADGFVHGREQTDLRLAELQGGSAVSADATANESMMGAPYHLVVTALNLTSSHDLSRRDRKSDHFLFTPRYCGSATTGYLPTDVYRGGETKLARAIGISGAAAAPGMGRGTFFAQALAMTVTNVRLGQWMENPGYRGGRCAGRQESGVFWPYYLLRELLGLSDARRRLVYLSDGGHTGDNLGIVPLLERRCGLIVACDAESDPRYHFGSLTNALRQIYVDANVKIDIDVTAARAGSAGHCAEHFAIGRIRYPEIRNSAGKTTDPAATGWLLVLKASLTGDELARIDMYKRDHPDFPQHTTADQFFDDDEFEAFRELGYHIAKQVLGGMGSEAFQCGTPEWTSHWEAFFAKHGGAAARATAFANRSDASAEGPAGDATPPE